MSSVVVLEEELKTKDERDEKRFQWNIIQHSHLHILKNVDLCAVTTFEVKKRNWLHVTESHNLRLVFSRGSRVVQVWDRGLPCHEFEPSTTKDPPCRAAMHVKSVESSNVLPWCGVEVRREGCQLRCRPRHLTMVENYVVCRQKPSCS
ncbi:uncharacterized protein TNCV_422911 [Trichonephila clavipes]|nr:uncharacterized protein TNCV_422911 [Trichonephila clavipes]